MKNFLPTFQIKKLGTYVAVIVIFVHNVVLDKDLECSCKQQVLDCNFYMIMPSFLVFILQLWTDTTFQRALKYTCACTCDCPCGCEKRCKLFCVLVYHIVKAVLVALLWVTSVYIDGDWFVCCMNDESEQQAQLACKEKHNLTAEDRATIAQLKNRSTLVGMSLLFCILLLAALISSFGLRCCKDSSCCNRNILYYKVILDEEENVLKEILTKAAKEQLTDAVKSKMDRPDWQKCFDAAKELVEQPTAPRFPEAAENQENGVLLEHRRPEDRRPEDRRPEDRRPEAGHLLEGEEEAPVSAEARL
ncbi:uncharacterized protein LOC117940306 [Etheostoma cragini]|uniref:uncharacterized protein LOC117940306 n=1 Tax=Etheostoma cragini TaxID=417921 RepID=UPI00155F4F7D|nr:uncharacterized protein LOC117940306 [Etheostoma cragini]